MSEPLFPAEDFSDCLIVDRHKLRRLARKYSENVSQDNDLIDSRRHFEAQRARSRAEVEQRRAKLPKVEWPSGLPVVERLQEIRDTIARHQVVVLCGETGSGKSTQLPKICLDLGQGVHGRIGHTQPRRIAARSLAGRIASELGQTVGQSVGYKVRFADKVGQHTHIKLLTDGMLLAEIARDRFLNEYDTLIIDEAHERSLNIDFLLGYLKQLLPKRPDLKLIVTSATIDPQRFSLHFGGAPIIEVSGRTYPVEVRYRPPPEDEEGGRDKQQGLLDAVDELSMLGRGDILVFFSGEREIREAAESLRKHKLKSTEVLPLYARQAPAEQARIFQASGKRHIVLATNVAETSLTVPGVRYVIDTGLARISRYSARSKIQRLPVEAISRASAEQRKGRCGRVAEGVCIRLYSEEDFAGRSEFTEPEIARTNLASVILQMKALGFGDIEAFPFVDPPEARLIKDGYRTLLELQAVDHIKRISKLGRKLARLPIDPKLARMLLEAANTGCLRELLVIAAALSVQDPRERPFDKQQQADEAHALFVHERSDFLGQLKLWDFLEERRHHLTRRKFERLCREYFLSPTRVREWHDIHLQLKEQMHELGYHDNDKPADYPTVHQAIITGLLSNLGQRTQRKERDYLGARNTHFHIFPGSGQFSAQPKWLVAAEVVETSKLYARSVAQIQPEWIERLAEHLVKRHYSEPHWQAKKGLVGAYEKVTLYGLPIVPKRRVNYGPIDPQVSREIFIRFGLVEGEVYTRAPFWRHNQELIAALHEQEARTRRRDVLVDEEAIYNYYNQRLPEHLHSTALLEKWLRGQTNKKLLYMRPEDVQQDLQGLDEAQFPDALMINSVQLPLSYHFEPGSDADGVTLHVPLPLLNQLEEGHVDWLVPGLIEEKIVALIKSLPKSLRRQLVPAPDVARRALQIMVPQDAPLRQALGSALKQLTGVHIAEDQWHTEDLNPYLRMRLRLLAADGIEVIAHSRDLLLLQRDYADRVLAGSGSVAPNHALEVQGLRDWQIGDLPEQVETRSGGLQMTAYPALLDEGDSVAVKLLDSRARAEQAQRQGLRRLLMLRMAPTVKDVRKQIRQQQALKLQYAKVPARGGQQDALTLDEQLLALSFDQAFFSETDPMQVRDKVSFEACYEAGRAQLYSLHAQTLSQISEVLGTYQKLRKRLANSQQIDLLSSMQDVQQQLDDLVYQGFLTEVPLHQLQQYPRYLKALELRLDKLSSGGKSRDQAAQRELAGLDQRWRERATAARNKAAVDQRLEEIRWQLQELRISLFAQEVKTLYPVSVKRIDKRWRELGL